MFGRGGLLGGGERYPIELARALAPHVECELITFGPRPALFRDKSGLKVLILKPVAHLGGHPAHPLAPGLIYQSCGCTRISFTLTTSKHTEPGSGAYRQAYRLPYSGHRSWPARRRLGGPPARPFRPLPSCVPLLSPRTGRASRTHRHYLWRGGPGSLRAQPRRAARGGAFRRPHHSPQRGRPPDQSPARGGLPSDRRVDRARPGTSRKPLPDLLQSLARDRKVTFLGPVADSELPGLYRSAAVLALPSVDRSVYGKQIRVSELLGLVALEAMSSGTPVVASRTGGLPEVVEHGVTGFLVSPGDVGELRDRLSELLADPELAARMGKAARERVLEMFTWRKCAERCLEAYEELFASGAAQSSGG